MNSQFKLWFALGPLTALIFLSSLKPSEAQYEPIPLDETVVEIIERIPAPQEPLVSIVLPEHCGEQPPDITSGWVLIDDAAGEPTLCNVSTGEVKELKIHGNWVRDDFRTGLYFQPAASPDGKWLILTSYDMSQFTFTSFAYSLETNESIELGTIEETGYGDTDAPHHFVWLTPTDGAFFYGYGVDGFNLFGFNLLEQNSITRLLQSGYFNIVEVETSVRIESLFSERQHPSSIETEVDQFPCEFTIIDAQGLRTYPLEYECQTTAFTHFQTESCHQIQSDGETLLTLRVIDFDEGLSELVSYPVTTAETQPTILFSGEIDYMMQDSDGATLSVLGNDGIIPSTIYRNCPYPEIEMAPFLGSDILLGTQRGALIIPAEDLPASWFVEILGVSQDKSQILLTNGAIYDVVEGVLVANITAGMPIHRWTDARWLEDGSIVLTENYYSRIDDQITIRLRGV